MSRLDELKEFPMTMSAAEAREGLAGGCSGWHESMFRSYQVLKDVRRWIRAGAPASVVLEMIEHAYPKDCAP